MKKNILSRFLVCLLIISILSKISINYSYALTLPTISTDFNPTSTESYIIESVYNGRYFHHTTANNTLNVWSYSEKNFQNWYIQKNSDNTYSFRSKYNPAQYVEVYCANYNVGQPLTLYDYTGNPNSPAARFYLRLNSDGSYCISPKSAPNLVFTVFSSEGTTYEHNDRTFEIIPNQTIVLSSYTGASNQCWNIQSLNQYSYDNTLSEGTYYIKNQHTGEYLYYYASDNCAITQTYSANLRQRWIITQDSNGYYYIQPECKENYYIEVHNGENQTGQPIKVIDYGNNTNSPFIKLRLQSNSNGSFKIQPIISPTRVIGVFCGNTGIYTYSNRTFLKTNEESTELQLKSSAATQNWFFEPAPKRAVILLHGRGDNSLKCFGAQNSIINNKTFNSDPNAVDEDNKKYVDLNNQKIIPPTIYNYYDETNLAYELEQHGYEPNLSLFVFNYPNEDAVVHNATKFKYYIEALIEYLKSYGTTEEKHAFGLNGNNYEFDIIGHSMGGLVARYYIENLDGDEHVNSLITIDTPHWGAGMAETSCEFELFAFDFHKLCDHDLLSNSALFGGDESTIVSCDRASKPYVVSSALQYDAYRKTKYYAIAGINYNAASLSSNNTLIELQYFEESYSGLLSAMQYETNNKLYDIDGNPIDIRNVDDNVVELLSQIGWTNNSGNVPNKTISFEKIIINIDSNGGNSLIADGHLHSKMQHRICITDKIIEILVTE